MAEIDGGWYMGKSAKGLTLLRRSTLIKQHNIRRMKLIKLYEADKWWNDWKFQLHWQNLEWVNPRSQIKRNKPFSVSSYKFYLNKGDKTSHWVGH